MTELGAKALFRVEKGEGSFAFFLSTRYLGIFCSTLSVTVYIYTIQRSYFCCFEEHVQESHCIPLSLAVVVCPNRVPPER